MELKISPCVISQSHPRDLRRIIIMIGSILEGQGVVRIGDQSNELEKGIVILIPPNVKHQFTNTSAQPLRFLCMIPNQTKDAS
jgi:quercetin dioxygenase-like cupin family protein